MKKYVDFDYVCHVSSELFEENVVSDRTEFDIVAEIGNLLSKSEISFKEIDEAVIQRISSYLENYLETNKLASKERLYQFVDTKAPQYRPLLNSIDDNDLILPTDCDDSVLELKLHKKKAALELELLSKGQEVLNVVDFGKDYPTQALDEFLSKVDMLKKSDLAAYVGHRWKILNIFDKMLMKNREGKYTDESFIHKLIMPMQKTSNEISADSANLWIIDEKLAFHHYLGSDKTFNSMPITGSKSTQEPDIVAFELLENPTLISESHNLPLAAITIVELKKPLRNDYSYSEEKNPLGKTLEYLELIRNGGAFTANGRPIPGSENIPGFCYLIADLTPSLIKQCRYFSFTPTAGQDGYFGYNPNYKAYIEVISYDKLINDAQKRNRAFFDKLGLPCSTH